jgi:drug/metabolite transporter (DMT)-like permease
MLAFMNMYYAYLAFLNKGVVSVIWGLNPLFIAFIDSIVYNQKLTKKHFFGFLSLVICTAALAMTGVVS